MSAILAVRNLEKTFGSVVAARDISLDVPPAQTIGIIGANGAGKTTFVNMITGHIKPSNGSIRFEDHLGYHDYEGPAVDLGEQERLVRDLGTHNAMILRSHGLLTCGPSIPEAFNTMYQLELACRTQVDAMAARTELVVPSKETLEKTAHLYQPGTRRPYGVLEWPAMLRLLEAEQKNSAFPPYWN